MKDFILKLNENHPVLYLFFMLVVGLMILSMILTLIFSFMLKLLTINKRNDIYKYYVENSPEVFKPWVSIRFGSWLRNIDVPFIYWRFFQVFYKMTKDDVRKWRNVVKISFGKYYIIYMARLITKKVMLAIVIPMLIGIAINMIFNMI